MKVAVCRIIIKIILIMDIPIMEIKSNNLNRF